MEISERYDFLGSSIAKVRDCGDESIIILVLAGRLM